MILFVTLFAINLLAALVAFAFFIIGLADGSVTTMNILLWAGMLGLLFSLPFGAWLLRLRGQRQLATVVLLPMAGIAALAAVAIAVMIISPPNWQ